MKFLHFLILIKFKKKIVGMKIEKVPHSETQAVSQNTWQANIFLKLQVGKIKNIFILSAKFSLFYYDGKRFQK